MRKQTICICENKDTDQLRSNCEADHCFRYTDSTIPLLSKSKISSFYPASVTAQACLCQTYLETTPLFFPLGGSFNVIYLLNIYNHFIKQIKVDIVIDCLEIGCTEVVIGSSRKEKNISFIFTQVILHDI